MTYRSEIDGLRAIAVLAVVFYHAGIAPKAGYVGVDVFFVISGYLITALLLREWSGTGRIDLLAFYSRRVRRIFPAAVAVVAATLGASTFFLTSDEFTLAANSAGAAAVFGANFFFQVMTGGYFDARAEDMPLLHLWSLAVEEQFYLFWPALLIALLRWRPKRLPLVLAALGLASFALTELLMRLDPEAAFYQMPARIWELAAGGLVAALPARKGLPAWVADIGVSVTLMACLLPFDHFPGLGALPAVAGTSIFLTAVHGGDKLGMAGAWLRSPPMVGVGLISYSLYLWHWPLLALYHATTIGEGKLQIRLILCAIAVLLAIASYRYVEQPFRRFRAPKGRIVAMGIAVSTSAAVAACGWGYNVQRVETTTAEIKNPLSVIAENDRPPGFNRCTYVGVGAPQEVPKPGCESLPGVPPTVAIWGDSFGISWQPFAWEIAARSKLSATAFHFSACAPLIGFLPPDPLPGAYKCRDFNGRVAKAVRGMDTLVIVARWPEWLQTPESVQSLRTTIAQVAPTVRRVLIIGPTPEMRDSVMRCIKRNDASACDVSRAEYDAQAAPLRKRLAGIVADFPNVELIDPADFLCTRSNCPAVKGGIAMYLDNCHLSATATTAFALEYLAN